VPSFPVMRILLAIATLLLLPHASQAASRACTPSDTTLCLLGGRFSASLQWNDGSGTRDAYVAQSKTDGSNSAAGLFYFYPSDSANWEVLVKVIDGCNSNSRFWTLVSASTGFGWTLSVRDEATGTFKTFSHPLDGKASGVSDFAAFATCGSAPPGPTPTPANCGTAGPYTDTCRGTILDRSTRLEWEKKTRDSGIHSLDNTYTWTVSYSNFDGTVMSTFLSTLNTPPCFAEHCDWRLPTIEEFAGPGVTDYPFDATGGIVDQTVPGCGSRLPCINAIFGPTQANYYWSSSSYFTSSVWVAGFYYGSAGTSGKGSYGYVRAVRLAP
jgi:Protein of unknown function (DUF1566)